MANTVQNGNRIAWTYTDDNATAWRVSAKQVYVQHATDGVKYGGTAAAPSVPAKPRTLRMRRVYCTLASGKVIGVPAYTTAAALWTTPGTTLTRDENGVDATATSTARRLGERQPGRQTYQST